MSECVKCGYDLRHLNGAACPECGQANDHDSVVTFIRKRDQRRALWGGAAVLLIASTCFIMSSMMMFGPNLGWPIGYYGELNRTKARVRAIDGVTIDGVRVNYDMSVEEFSIDVIVDGVHRASIYVPDVPMDQRLVTVDAWEKDELPRIRGR